MEEFSQRRWGNPSSIHHFGRRAKEALEEARDVFAKALCAHSSELVFTSGGTESANLALRGAAYAKQNQGRHILASAVEHPAVLQTLRALQKEGFELTLIPVDQYGRVDLDFLKDHLRSTTILVSVMAANNEVGTLQPLKEIGELLEKSGALFHTDAVQALGKIPVSPQKWRVDLLSASSHKLNGPTGAGLLYVRKGTKLSPLFHGGGQEFGLRRGTENLLGIVGFAQAMRVHRKLLEQGEIDRLASLTQSLRKGINDLAVPTRINTPLQGALPNTLNVAFLGRSNEQILFYLDSCGIAVSGGSACSSQSAKPSHVLLAMGLSRKEALSSLRFSFGLNNTQEDVDYVLEKLQTFLQTPRQIR